MTRDVHPHWDRQDFETLLDLLPVDAMRWCSRVGDPNARGRAYGGQLMALAIAAMTADVPPGRRLSACQLLFLRGADPSAAIQLEVKALQDGKRFTSRSVVGTQGDCQAVFSAHASFAEPLGGFGHQAPPAVSDWLTTTPDALPGVESLRPEWREKIRRFAHYAVEPHPVIDVRFADPPQDVHLGLALPHPRMRLWSRSRLELGDDMHLHAAVFAYISDFWFNYCVPGGHLGGVDAPDSVYVASLNHSIWLHRPLRADEWLHFDCASPSVADGRGLSQALVHDVSGRLVASVVQECLIATHAD